MDQKRKDSILREALTQLVNQKFETPVDLWSRIQEKLSEQGERVSAPISLPTLPSGSTRPIQIGYRGSSVMLVSMVAFVVFLSTMIVINTSGNHLDAASPAAIAFEYGGHVTSTDNEVAINAMNQAGMSWMKIQLRYNTSGSDNAANEIATAHANGFKLLVSAGGNPDDLRTGGEGYIQQYANWLGQMAKAGVDAIEVWIEPNLDREWPEGQISGGAYANMLRVSYQAIKAANPNTLVISAAPAPTGAEASFPDQVRNDDAWLRELVRGGGLQYMDCVGDYYEGILPPDATNGDPRGESYMRYFTSMLNTYSDTVVAQKPLCFTELGYLSAEGIGTLPPPFAWASKVTVWQQAAWLAQAAMIASQSSKVRLMIVWNVNFTTYGSDPQSGYAIVRPDRSCPACDTLADMP